MAALTLAKARAPHPFPKGRPEPALVVPQPLGDTLGQGDGRVVVAPERPVVVRPLLEVVVVAVLLAGVVEVEIGPPAPERRRRVDAGPPAERDEEAAHLQTVPPDV